ncbi:hypothetical protein IV38_GL000715 [Lactobacillus selangorensis]|uniref:Uncharacterized protein n=1 Tax=Lactobacillus selangorensis TaxID=81857 RepID=A0A0R2FPF6_9LACO|nr:hypothetical protein [Lactobacillus selangorensis]KRN27223.1 hypothetical protein IV38_GL000715 [Lactobacillus selangorensis]KRN29855.1 hypothetical protein IV40_GL000563 [Lactobacillus selangorensis]
MADKNFFNEAEANYQKNNPDMDSTYLAVRNGKYTGTYDLNLEWGRPSSPDIAPLLSNVPLKEVIAAGDKLSQNHYLMFQVNIDEDEFNKAQNEMNHTGQE